MEKRVKLEIGNLLLMCLNANQIEGYTIHFDYHGHVNEIDLRIRKSSDDEYVFYDSLYVKGNLFNEAEFDKTMKVWKKQLTNLLQPDVVLSEA